VGTGKFNARVERVGSIGKYPCKLLSVCFSKVMHSRGFFGVHGTGTEEGRVPWSVQRRGGA